MSRSNNENEKKPKKLTDAKLSALPAAEKRYEYAIERGLLLEVLPSGKKTFRYRYRYRGKREKVSLGPLATEHQPGLTLQQARIEQAKAAQLLLSGISPARNAREEKNGRKAALVLGTFAQVADQWLRIDHRPANKNPAQDETYLTRDVLPRLGPIPIAEITSEDVWSCVEPLHKSKHYQAALRVKNVVKRVFDFAIRNNFKGHNPAMVIKDRKIASKSIRTRVLSFAEIPAWLEEIRTSSLSRMMKLAFDSLLLVPVRKTELLHAPWTEFDLGAGTWTIPEARSKTGVAITHKLPRQQLAILQQLKEMGGGSKWVFPSNRGGGKNPVSKSCINTALRAISEGPSTVVPHDLRRTVRTGMSKIGVPRDVAEKCLNHNRQDPYDHDDLYEPRGEALQKWADHIDKLVADYQLRKLSAT